MKTNYALATVLIAVLSAVPTTIRAQALTNLTVKTIRLDEHVIEQVKNSFDAADSYNTPKGPRSLHRLAGAVAVRSVEGNNAKASLDELTKAGGALEGYARHLETKRGFSFLKASSLDAKSKGNAAQQKIEALRKAPGVAVANPVLVDPDTGLWLLTTDELIVALKPGVDAQQFFGEAWNRVKPIFALGGQYLLRLTALESEAVFAEVNRLMADPRVAFAEPSFNHQGLKSAIPNDPLFSSQWHLRNTGQSNGIAGADIKAAPAWDHTMGSPSIVIAILDDGFDLTHPDLIANIYTNAIEAQFGNDGLDNDSDGYVDNFRGWDFFAGDNDPSPVTAGDHHGTLVAGMAVARANNALGVAGSAPNCKFLPLRVSETAADGSSQMNSAGLLYAIYNAAGINPQGYILPTSADVISMSFEVFQQAAYDAAFSNAVYYGRNGKGCVLLSATGNHGDGWATQIISGFPSGSITYAWRYSKDAANSAGEDAAWLYSVTFPDGTTEKFDGATFPPANWTTSGNANWMRTFDPAHSLGRYTNIVRSGVIGNNQSTTLQTTRSSVSGGQLRYTFWVSSESSDTLSVLINGTPNINHSGVPFTRSGPSYPASNPDVIAVGATSDADLRAYYSQIGGKLDIMAPGGDQLASQGVLTTDRVGAAGEAAGDYASIQGTSFACPLAAGVSALVLSINPNLTYTQVRDILRKTAVKVGPVAYTNGTNAFYGYGRIDAEKAVMAAESSINDVCNDAIAVASTPYTRTQSTFYATSAGDPSSCNDGNGVWYKFIAPTNGLLTAKTIGSSFDTVVAIYSGSCGALTLIHCDDDAWLGNITSSNTVTATAGTTYYILAGGYLNATGTLVMNVSFTPFTAPTGSVAAVGVKARTVELQGNVNPGLQQTTVWFELGTNTLYGITSSLQVISGSQSSNVTQMFYGLRPATTYHYRLVATNASGIFRTADQTFATPADTTVLDILSSTDTVYPTSTNSPVGEESPYAFDNNVKTKYLNFDKLNTGLTIVPSGNRVVRALTLISAEDAPERDPSSFVLEGSDDGVNFIRIASNAVPVFPGRRTIQSFNFANTNDYNVYRLQFPTVVNSILANSMQIAEVELLPYGEITSSNDVLSLTLPPGTANVRGTIRLFDRNLGDTNKFEIAPIPASSNTIVDVTLAAGSRVLKGFQLIGGGDDLIYPERRPSSVTVVGSVDGVNFTILRTVVPAYPLSDVALQDFGLLTNMASFPRYRFIFGSPVGGDRLQIGELRLFGEAPDVLPTLTVRVSGNQLLVSWPNGAGFNLETNATLNDTNWIPSGITPLLTNGVNTVTIPMNATSGFLRLRK